MVVFVLAACACVFMNSRYTANSIIQLEKSSSDSLGLDSLMGQHRVGLPILFR